MVKSGWAALRLALLVPLILASWGGRAPAQITPTVHAAATQSIDIPSNRQAGAMQILDTSGNVIGTAANPMYTTASGGGSGGTSSNFAAAFPTAGTAIGAKAGSNMVNLTADGSGNLNVNVAASAGGLALDTSVGTTNTDLGPPGATVCATDTGSCSLNALMQRIAARLTTVNGTLGGTLATAGPTASGASFTANPLPSGGRAQNAEATAVTNGQAVAAAFDLVGKQIVLPYSDPQNLTSGVITSAMTGTSSVSLLGAPAGSLRNYVTEILCYNTHATVSTDILIQDGSGGTTIGLIPAAAVYGGATVTLLSPLRQPTAATGLFVANVTTGASTKCWANGYTGV